MSRTSTTLPSPSIVAPATVGSRPMKPPSSFTTSSSSPSSSSTASPSISPEALKLTMIAARGSRSPGTSSTTPRSTSGNVFPCRTSTGTPASSCRSAPARPMVSTTPATGTAYRSDPTRATRQRRTPSVTGSVITNRVPTPGSDWTSIAPLRSPTTVRTTSRPTPRPEVWVISDRGREAGREDGLQQRPARRGSVSAGTRPRAMAAVRKASSSTPFPSSATSMTTVEPAARADTVTVAWPGLPRATRSAGVSQPWSTALVTRWRSESATVSSTRVSSSTSWPVRMRRTSLASGPVAGELADELREAGDHTAYRDHREAHGPVAHRPEPALRVLAAARAARGWRPQLVAEGDERVQRLRGGVRQREARGPALVAASRSSRDHFSWLAASVDRSRPWRASRRISSSASPTTSSRSWTRRVGHPDRSRRCGGRGSSTVGSSSDAARPAWGPRPGPRPAQRPPGRRRSAPGRRADRAVRAGHRPGDALGGDEQQVDEVLARRATGRRAARRAGPRRGAPPRRRRPGPASGPSP